MLQEKRFAEDRCQAAERPAHRLVPVGPVGGVARRCSSERDVVANEDPVPASGATSRRPAPVYQDPEHPATESVFIAAREGAIRPNERVLEGLFGVFPIAQHMHGVAPEPIAVARDQHGKRGGVARAHPAHDVRVGHCHLLVYPRDQRTSHLLGRCDAAERPGVLASDDLHREILSMQRLTIATAVSLIVLAGCYKDDTLTPAGIAPTRVLLTDDPFPFDSVKSVNIYVTRIEASADFDTSGAGNWVQVAAPQKTFDLLTLQQGTTANLGAGVLDAGQYAAIRMTIDVDKSSIKYPDNSDAIVHWSWPGHGEITIYALVEEPVAVAATGAEIVIDFDVGRSFQYKLFGEKAFTFLPVLRAVNSAATGTLEGTVTATPTQGPPYTLANANITVYGGDPNAAAATWYVVATGHTDLQGHYKVAYLRAGSYIVRVEQPIIPAFAAVTTPNVGVSVGATTTYNVQLPRAGAGLHISGATTIGVGGATLLHASFTDSSGAAVDSAISWTSRAPTIAIPVDSAVGDTLQHDKMVVGLLEGSAWIVATSGTMADSVQIQVVSQPNPNPVKSVTVTPPTLDLAVGDSAYLHAELRDSLGNILPDRGTSWFPADSSGVVALLQAVGPDAVVRASVAGTVVIRAICEGKLGSATITVH